MSKDGCLPPLLGNGQEGNLETTCQTSRVRVSKLCPIRILQCHVPSKRDELRVYPLT